MSRVFEIKKSEGANISVRSFARGRVIFCPSLRRTSQRGVKFIAQFITFCQSFASLAMSARLGQRGDSGEARHLFCKNEHMVNAFPQAQCRPGRHRIQLTSIEARFVSRMDSNKKPSAAKY